MAKTSNGTPKKTECPITRKQFVEGAKAMQVTLGGLGTVVAVPKEFSTGSLGWNANDKVTMMVDGVAVKVQVGVNLTVIGSKDAK